jgi:hypothetical protein
VLDFRVKKPKSGLNWRYQEIIVDQAYIDAGNGMIVTLDSPYEMGIKALDVYYNGQRLSDGGGFEEIDQLHIKLDIYSVDQETGTNAPLTQLYIGDEIIIKEWFNSSSILYGEQGFNNRLTALEQEIAVARGGFPLLGGRLDSMDAELANLLGEGNYTIQYTYDTNGLDIIKEEVAGDFNVTREHTYNTDGKPVQEKITRSNVVTTRDYQYDSSTGRVVKVTSQTVTN